MKCPYCGNEDTKVIDSRTYNQGNSIKRRRECEKCLKRFNTSEKIFNLPLIVVKKSGECEKFNRDKIYNGLIRSLVKREYDQSKLDEIIEQIQREILSNYGGKVTTSILGDLIMSKLLELDEVAYVRFASVYNKFDNLDSFINIIKEVKQKKKRNKK